MKPDNEVWQEPHGSEAELAGITITASEVHDYFYCPYSWWFKRSHGVGPGQVARMSAGTAYHERLVTGRPDSPTRRWRWLLLAGAVVLGIAAAISLFVGV